MTGLILAIALIASPDSARDSIRTFQVSLRVGAVIGIESRTRFHLFPGINEFRDARFLQLPDSTWVAEVQTGTGNSITTHQYSVTRQRVRKIGYYVDHYEDIVPQLAELPDGARQIQGLWDGLGGTQIEANGAAIHGLATRPAPPTNRIADAIGGAATGLGVGGCVGARVATQYVRTRPESVWVNLTSCLFGLSPPDTHHNGYWDHFNVREYELNRTAYYLNSMIGVVLGGAAGFQIGRHADLGARRRSPGEVVDFDVFGDPITEREVRAEMSSSTRIIDAFLGSVGGGLAGLGVGLGLAAIVRQMVFGNTPDSIEVKNDGFAFSLPVVTLCISGLLNGGYQAYRSAEQKDWQAALERVKAERVYAVTAPR
jgi:hypothetical protein